MVIETPSTFVCWLCIIVSIYHLQSLLKVYHTPYELYSQKSYALFFIGFWLSVVVLLQEFDARYILSITPKNYTRKHIIYLYFQLYEGLCCYMHSIELVCIMVMTCTRSMICTIFIKNIFFVIRKI